MIVITAFEAIPGAGTEAGLAWNWGMAYVHAGHQVTVLTSASKESMKFADVWREAGMDVVFLGGSVEARAPQTPKELFVVARAFGKWSKACRAWLADVTRNITAVHHVSWGSARLKPPFLDVHPDVTTVWGPLGGGQLAQFSGLLAKNRLHEFIRALSIPTAWALRSLDFARYSPPTLALATNNATLRYVRAMGISRVETMLADGVQPATVVSASKQMTKAGPVNMVWLGRMVASKRPDIAIILVGKLAALGIPVSLTMIGDGPERSSLEKQVNKLGVDKLVEFVGRVPWEDTFNYYDQSHYLVFTSMRDSSCPAVLEAAARGVPTLCFRHQGVAALVPETIAMGPSTFVSADDLASHLADIVVQMHEDNERYNSASKKALSFAQSHTWGDNVQRVLESLEIGRPK